MNTYVSSPHSPSFLLIQSIATVFYFLKYAITSRSCPNSLQNDLTRHKCSPELPRPLPLPKTIYFGSRTFGLPYTYFAFFIYSIEEEEEEEWTVFLLCLRLVLALLKR